MADQNLSPATYEIRIISTDGKNIDEIRICTLSGNLILQTVDLSSPVDISDLVSGVYLMELRTGDRHSLVKLVIL